MTNTRSNPNAPSHRSDAAAGFDTLVQDYQDRIYFFIRTMVFNPSDARDVQQDVNVIMLRKREQFELGTNFKAWAFAIARFECLNYLARHKKASRLVGDTEMLEQLAHTAEERAEELPDWKNALKECLGKLTPEDQDLIASRYNRRTPLEQAAQRRGTSVGAIKQKLFRARAKLKRCIEFRIK